MLPVRFRKLDIASSSLLSPPPSAAVTALQSPLPRERHKEGRLDGTGGGGRKLLSYLFNFRPRGNNIHCVREPRYDTVPTDIAPNHRETYLFIPPVKPYPPPPLFISSKQPQARHIFPSSLIRIHKIYPLIDIDPRIRELTPFSLHQIYLYLYVYCVHRRRRENLGEVRLPNSVMQFLSKKLKR